MTRSTRVHTVLSSVLPLGKPCFPICTVAHGRSGKCRPTRRGRRTQQQKIGMTSLIRTDRRYHVSADRGRGCNTRIGPFRTVVALKRLYPHMTPSTTTGGGYGPGPGGYGPRPHHFMPPAFPPALEMVLSKCKMLCLMRPAAGQGKKGVLPDCENAAGFNGLQTGLSAPDASFDGRPTDGVRVPRAFAVHGRGQRTMLCTPAWGSHSSAYSCP